MPKKKFTERWPWNRLVKRPQEPSGNWKDEKVDPRYDREADGESPLTGDVPHSHVDPRTPEEN